MSFVEQEQYAAIMRTHCVMFYSSTESHHIHYHPFEAIQAGMPLLFMAGGMLDKLGGGNLPGRCKSIKEARTKIKRIFNHDKLFIEHLRLTQAVLLEAMKPENCKETYKRNFNLILDELATYRHSLAKHSKPQKRIAVILPLTYSGGTLRGMNLLIKALLVGSKLDNEDVEIIIAHPDNERLYNDDTYSDVPTTFRRVFHWKMLDKEAACRAMIYAGHGEWQATETNYIVPDDGINYLLDCDLWLIISDRLEHPLLPLRPYVLMIYDYLQRYIPCLPQDINMAFLSAAHHAQRIMVTTDFTAQDAIQYAGLKPEKVFKVPFLVPKFKNLTSNLDTSIENPYFIWTTNKSLHKNHVNAFLALQEYYERWGGNLECYITGCETKKLLDNESPHLRQVYDIYQNSSTLKKKVKILGELFDATYQQKLKHATFLWHAAQIDNGTFSVLEAAQFSVPSLSSDYPAMREINALFKIGLAWMNSDNPRQMAAQLKWMEEHHGQQRSLLANNKLSETLSFNNLAIEYWKVVRECL
ncbi:MAG: hypothetical protein QM652_01475 [Legionella sp.]|uniref:glycosyltransferase n=1 Tax=Legionella sp. TaxID=459 RepID=UPI0039E66BAC